MAASTFQHPDVQRKGPHSCVGPFRTHDILAGGDAPEVLIFWRGVAQVQGTAEFVIHNRST